MFKLLGRYDNFPTNIHGVARFTCPESVQMLETAMIQVFHKLNKQTVDMKALTKASPANCRVNFEFGIADADTFSFLDEEELGKLENTLKEQALRVLDVLCVARYRIVRGSEEQKSIRFDYSMLRFAFYRRNMELFICHERGIQRIPLEDLVLFLKSQIDQELVDRQQKTLTLRHIHTL